MIALSLFDKSGNMLKPWLDAGYECHLFDIQHPPGQTLREDGFICHGYDLADAPCLDGIDDVCFISCFPPCTHLAVSGARWFAGKGLRALQESIGYFATCIDVVEHFNAPYMIENPMSTIATYWRSADHKFHPFHFNQYCEQEDYTKETWLWVGNGFRMPAIETSLGLFDEPDRKFIHYQPDSKGRDTKRSETPMGFAIAAYLANKD